MSRMSRTDTSFCFLIIAGILSTAYSCIFIGFNSDISGIFFLLTIATAVSFLAIHFPEILFDLRRNAKAWERRLLVVLTLGGIGIFGGMVITQFSEYFGIIRPYVTIPLHGRKIYDPEAFFIFRAVFATCALTLIIVTYQYGKFRASRMKKSS